MSVPTFSIRRTSGIIASGRRDAIDVEAQADSADRPAHGRTHPHSAHVLERYAILYRTTLEAWSRPMEQKGPIRSGIRSGRLPPITDSCRLFVRSG
jgi:hypothetical protein